MNNQADFEQTPLFQMNLMLWLVWSSPFAGIKPIFREEGFRLRSIGQPLTLSFPAATRIRAASVEVQDTACPDLLFEHTTKNVFLPIECKSHSFSPTSSDIRQANCLLCHTGHDIAQIIGLDISPRWNAHLYYVVPDDDQHLMLESLRTLSTTLESNEIARSSSGSIGIRVTPSEGIYLEFCNDVDHFDSSGYDLPHGWVEVKQLKLNESPEPLYLLPVDLTSGKLSDVAVKSLQERMRSSLAVLIVQRLKTTEFQITEDELMSTAVEVWDYWKEANLKAGLMRAIRPYLRSVITALEKTGVSIHYSNRVISFTEVNSETAKEIRRFLRRKDYRTESTIMEETLKDFGQMRLPFSDDE